jgi:8-amino-7-oxononanoate synthase
VTDFTSSLYLGLEHAWEGLRAWPRLTLGKPAALEEAPGSGGVERELAALVGCERVLLSTSTLHAFHDVAAMFMERGTRIVLEESVYPVARLAAGCAAGAETFGPVCGVPLDRVLGRTRQAAAILTDGFVPARGEPAPLREYARRARETGGCLVIDDTQALGIFGTRAGPAAPYGMGGGGSLRRAGLGGEHVIVVASLAKAFGAPVAMVGGSEAMMRKFEQSSQTRVHCSPPSAASIAAAAQALEMNRHEGEGLRRRLARRVCRLRRGLRKLGLNGTESIFPVQPVRNAAGMDPHYVSEALLDRGIRAVLARAAGAPAAQIVFVVTTRHRLEEIDDAVEALAQIGPGGGSRLANTRNGRRSNE